MFSVLLAQLDDSCHRLYSIITKHNFEIHRLDMLIGKLNSLSGMNSIIRQLKIEKEKMERQRQVMLEMLRGLEKIRECYRMAERRILENGEGSRIKYVYAYRLENFSMFGTIRNKKEFPRIMT